MGLWSRSGCKGGMGKGAQHFEITCVGSESADYYFGIIDRIFLTVQNVLHDPPEFLRAPLVLLRPTLPAGILCRGQQPR